MNGDLARGDAIVQEVLQDDGTPQLFRGLAGAHRLIATPDGNQDLGEMIETLDRLARQHEEAELWFFAAISYYNLTLALYQHAEYARAASVGQRALELFELTGRQSEVPSTAAVLAICAAELSRHVESAEYAKLVDPQAANQDPDAVAQLAYLALTTGSPDAPGLLCLLPELRDSRRSSPTARTEAETVNAFSRIVLPDQRLGNTRPDQRPLDTVGIGSFVYALAVATLAAYRSGDRQLAFDAVLRAMEAAAASKNRTGSRDLKSSMPRSPRTR
jgi:hypothetical protein